MHGRGLGLSEVGIGFGRPEARGRREAALALYGYAVVKDQTALGGLFVMRNLLTKPLTYRVPVESNQRAPKLIEVLAPRHDVGDKTLL